MSLLRAGACDLEVERKTRGGLLDSDGTRIIATERKAIYRLASVAILDEFVGPKR